MEELGRDVFSLTRCPNQPWGGRRCFRPILTMIDCVRLAPLPLTRAARILAVSNDFT
jgi:hypothetical protein